MFTNILNIKKVFLIYSFFLFLIYTNSSAEDANLVKKLNETGKHKIFISILERNPLFLSLVNNTIPSTIYAPTDNAFALMPEDFNYEIKKNNIKYTTKLILTHIFSGDNLSSNKDQGMVLSLDGSLFYTYKSNDLFVKDIVIQGQAFKVGSFTVIPVDCVMFLQQSSKDYRLDKTLQNKYKFTSCCLQTPEEYNIFIEGL